MDPYAYEMCYGGANTDSLDYRSNQLTHVPSSTISASSNLPPSSRPYAAQDPRNVNFAHVQQVPARVVAETVSRAPLTNGQYNGYIWNSTCLDSLSNPVTAANPSSHIGTSVDIDQRANIPERPPLKRARQTPLRKQQGYYNCPQTPQNAPLPISTQRQRCTSVYNLEYPQSTATRSSLPPSSAQYQPPYRPIIDIGGQVAGSVPPVDASTTSYLTASLPPNGNAIFSPTIEARGIPDQAGHSGKSGLSDAQKRLIQEYVAGFAQGRTPDSLVFDEINAMATLIKAPSLLVWEYLNSSPSTRPIIISDPDTSTISTILGAQSPTPKLSDTASSLASLNPHFPRGVFSKVEKYIDSAHCRRSEKDGRRRRNEGHLRCTFGCVYHTKRPYDWKRHEETHLPQDLWLCYLCCQKSEEKTFLVNRKDKFSKHVELVHKEFGKDDVLEWSKLKFHAETSFACPFCEVLEKTWEGRCRHVQAHYEDEEGGRVRGMSGRPESL